MTAGSSIRLSWPVIALYSLVLSGVASCKCNQSTPEGSSQQLHRETLRIGYSPLTLNAPLFVALEANEFAAPVESTAFNSTNEMLAALVAGRIELASALTTESVFQANSLEPGIVKTVLYNTFTKATKADAVVLPAKAPVQDCSSLRVQGMGTYPAQSTVTYLKAAFGGELPIRQLPPNAILEALGSGAIDSAYLLEPQVTVALSKQLVNVACWSPLAARVQDPTFVGSHAINPKALRMRGWAPEEVQAALLRALGKIDKDRDSMLLAVEKYTKLPHAVLKSVGFPVWQSPSLETRPFVEKTCRLLTDAKAVDKCPSIQDTELSPTSR